MELQIRPGRPEDGAAIAPWTRQTFAWGDYVAEAFPDWLDEPQSRTLVAESEGEVVGLARAVMLSETEAWAQGIRIHPDHRRHGIGTAISRGLADWAAAEGARVIRLTVEDWNSAARAQVLRLGYRPIGSWVVAERGVGENSPVPEGNGGRRVPAHEGLRPAHSSEAQPAQLSWSAGPLERAARALVPVQGWRWRRLTQDDLAEAARRRALVAGRPGWAVAENEGQTCRVTWLSTEEEDAAAMVRALVDLAASAGADRLVVMVPAVDWLIRALRHRGCELHHLTIFALSL